MVFGGNEESINPIAFKHFQRRIRLAAASDLQRKPHQSTRLILNENKSKTGIPIRQENGGQESKMLELNALCFMPSALCFLQLTTQSPLWPL